MKTLKEILQEDEHILFEISERDRERFPLFAKANDCKWINGSEISPKENHCSNHMGINKKLQMGFVSAQCWCNQPNNQPRIINFNEIN